eukprot:15452783-Alexandrium_andersonii.AAC.1
MYRQASTIGPSSEVRGAIFRDANRMETYAPSAPHQRDTPDIPLGLGGHRRSPRRDFLFHQRSCPSNFDAISALPGIR